MANGERRPGARRCPLLAQSGHHATEFPCPLLGVERTSLGHSEMSAFDPKRTFGPDQAGIRTGKIGLAGGRWKTVNLCSRSHRADGTSLSSAPGGELALRWRTF